jgi:hypothetical protein
MLQEWPETVGKGEDKMSVKELKFNWPQYDCVVDIDMAGEDVRFIIKQHGATSAFKLDRNQAHLLMLYLQEHLK